MPDLPQLYQKMAELTLPKCQGCRVPMSCCDPMYCEMAESYSIEKGYQLPEKETGRLPWMGATGCKLAPHMRPNCTLHVCTINSLGFDPKDPKFTADYFTLREEIETLEMKEYEQKMDQG